MKGGRRMNSTSSSNKVINITNKIGERRRMVKKGDQYDGKSDTRVIAITSGKGGVGKTNIVANLGFAFSKLGKKVLILDADWGLGNLQSFSCDHG
jgi:flagellar biosynthesis protein FlhG